MAIDAYRLFCFYHLGFDDELEYRFRNLHHAVAHFGVPADVIKARLEETRMDADTISRSSFNLARAHADAMELDLVGAPTEQRRAFAKRSFAELRAALDGPLTGAPGDDVDWDDVWGDEP